MMMSDRSAAYQRAAHDVIAANSIEPLRLTVISASMWPWLRPGDVVSVHPIDPAAIRVGDVVVVRHGTELITHRLIDLEHGQWVTRGDNVLWADAPLSPDVCLGHVVQIDRGTRSIDVGQARWAQLNNRLARLGRMHRRMARRLDLTSASAAKSIYVAWLIALPFRLLAQLMVLKTQAG